MFQVSVNELLLGKRVDDKVKLANETTMKMVRKERVLHLALSFLCLLCLMILDILLWVAGVDGILWYLIIGVVVILAFLIEFGAKKGL